MEKKTATKAGEKVKKTFQLKKAPKSPEFIGSNKEDKEPPLLKLKEEAQGFFYTWKESKNFTLEKRVEKVVFMGGPYEGHELLYVALYDTDYRRGVLKMSGLGKKTKDQIKQALAKV